MTKVCMGCGSTLQTIDPEKIGYVKDLQMDYCMRCFRLQHYHDFLPVTSFQDNQKILDRVNSAKGQVFYFVDFLNLHEEAISYYQKILLPKVFVVTKIDLIPKDLSFTKIKKWLQKEYGIQEEILFVQKDKEQSLKKIEEHIHCFPVYFVGITNAGKSTLLNQWFGDQVLTMSHVPNTTLEFIERKFEGQTFYDTPGLTYHYVERFIFLSSCHKRIHPMTYPLKKEAALVISDTFMIQCEENESLTILGSEKLQLKKSYRKDLSFYQLPSLTFSIPQESFLFIKGVCLIYLKNACTLMLYGLEKDQVSISHAYMGGFVNEQD